MPAATIGHRYIARDGQVFLVPGRAPLPGGAAFAAPIRLVCTASPTAPDPVAEAARIADCLNRCADQDRAA